MLRIALGGVSSTSKVCAGDRADAPSQPAIDGAPDDSASSSREALYWQLVEQLADLQREYQEIQTWFSRMQAQLSEREAQVRQRLRDALSQMEHAPPVADTSDQPNGLALYVRTFGRFTASYQQQDIPLGSNKNGRAIFRYLVTRPGRGAAKDVLLGLFWPDDPVEKAAHKLHIAISSLRQSLNEALGGALSESIVYADDRYAIASELHVRLDTDDFYAHVEAGERLEREGRLTEAIDRYQAARDLHQGEYLAEDLYADWAAAERARLLEMYLTLLGRLACYYADREQVAQSVDCCRQILSHDSFREDAYRQLMRCYSRLGHRNQALREFQRCRDVLRRELGVDPMRETVALYERIAREERV